MSRTDLILQLKGRIEDTLRQHMTDDRPIALLNYPNHSNVGDCAIWLGERAFLKDHDRDVVYRCDIQSYNRRHLQRYMKDGATIFMHGGGNFGDLWPAHQHFMRRVLEDARGHPLVVFPQTVFFRRRAALDGVRSAIEKHGQLTLVTRDQQSFSIALETFSCRVEMAPDMAFWLTPPSHRHHSTQRVLWLARTDKEAAGHRKPSIGEALFPSDWLHVDPQELDFTRRLQRAALQRLTGLLQRSNGRPRVVGRVQAALFDPVAEAHYQRGCRFLSKANVVIADRLHAHILCLLMGIPHVLLDDKYGKLRGFWNTWTKESALVHWANDVEAAYTLAHELALSAND